MVKYNDIEPSEILLFTANTIWCKINFVIKQIWLKYFFYYFKLQSIVIQLHMFTAKQIDSNVVVNTGIWYKSCK